MRLLSCRQGKRRFYGAIDGDEIIDLSSAEAPTLRRWLEFASGCSFDELRASSRPRVPLSSIEYLPPVTDPDKIICVGLNYRDHADEAGVPVPPHPSLFVRFTDSQVGHDRPVIYPTESRQFDYEAELAVVIGRRCRRVGPNDALDYVAGYSCFADNSARDWQKHAPQITPGKNFFASGAFGPWLVTPDELPELPSVEVIGRLNGEQVQRAPLANLIFPIPLLVSYISTFAELAPGDVIATGTPAGVGMARKPPKFLQPGDVFEVEVTGLGTLHNSIVGEEQA